MYRESLRTSTAVIGSAPASMKDQDTRDTVALAQRPHFRHMIKKVIASGERPIVEMLAQLAVRHDLEDEITECLAAYARLDHDALHITGGNRFSSSPIYAISGREVRS